MNFVKQHLVRAAFGVAVTCAIAFPAAAQELKIGVVNIPVLMERAPQTKAAMDALREVGPGSHFLGAAHTQANFETAFYRSTVADNNSFEQWEQDGSADAAMRANSIWKKMLVDYEAPPLDEAIDEALLEFIARRKSEFDDRDY